VTGPDQPALPAKVPRLVLVLHNGREAMPSPGSNSPAVVFPRWSGLTPFSPLFLQLFVS